MKENTVQKDVVQETPTIEPSLALHNLGIAARLAKLSADEHEMIGASFNSLAKLIGYKPPQAQPQTKRPDAN